MKEQNTLYPKSQKAFYASLILIATVDLHGDQHKPRVYGQNYSVFQYIITVQFEVFILSFMVY
jgi:hypothetical protein